MLERAQIIEIRTDEIIIIPLITDSCVNCTKSSCAKRGKPFSATNPNNLALTVGDIVQLKISLKYNLLQAAISLLGPIIVAIIAYFIAPPKESLQALFVIIGFILTGIIVTIISRFIHPVKSQIINVLH